jgi:hypothetical protein
LALPDAAVLVEEVKPQVLDVAPYEQPLDEHVAYEPPFLLLGCELEPRLEWQYAVHP